MITLTNGYPQGPNGLIVPNGSISFQLNIDATVIAAPYGFVAAAEEVVFQFNSAGQIQPNSPAAAAQIYSNAELNPQNSIGLGTYYLVTFYDQKGARLNKSPMWWQFPEAAGETVDISTMTAFATVGGNVIYYPTIFANTPGGSTTDVQVNINGQFYGDSHFTYVPTGSILNLGAAESDFSSSFQSYLNSNFGADYRASAQMIIGSIGTTAKFQGFLVVAEGDASGDLIYGTQVITQGYGVAAHVGISSVMLLDVGTGNTNPNLIPGAELATQNIGLGTLSFGCGVQAYVLNTGAGTIEIAAGFNAGSNTNPGGGTIILNTGYYCFTTNIGTTNVAYYSEDQGSNYTFYSVGGNNYFGGPATNFTRFRNSTVATSLANADSPAVIISGQAWVGTPSPSSQTIEFQLQEHLGQLWFTQIAGPAQTFPFQFGSNVQITGAVQAVSSEYSFNTGAAGTVYAIASAGNAVGALTTYAATVGAGAVPLFGQRITIAGFVTHTSNNGTFVVHDATLTTITVYNSSGTAETHSATGTLDSDYAGIAGFGVQLGLTTVNFPIEGTSYPANAAFNAFPNYPLFVMNLKGDAEDAAYLRILSGGTAGNHGLEIGSIIDGTGASPVTVQLGVFNGLASTVFNSPIVIPTTSPASSSTGVPGQISWDANFIYVCVATNTWTRAALTGGY